MEHYTTRQIELFRAKFVAVISVILISFILNLNASENFKMLSTSLVISISLMICASPIVERQHHYAINITIEYIQQALKSKFPEVITDIKIADERMKRLKMIPNSQIVKELLWLKFKSRGGKINAYNSKKFVSILNKIPIDKDQWRQIELNVDNTMIYCLLDPFFNPESDQQ